MTTPIPFPAPRGRPLDPPPLLGELRRRQPVARVRLWNGQQAWLVTRMSEVRAALADPRLSSDATDPNFPSINPTQVFPTDRGGLTRLDDPRHREIRQMLAHHFAVGAVRKLRPVAERIAAAQLAELLNCRQPADLVDVFAVPLPALMVCHVLGIPDADLPFFVGRSRIAVSRTDARAAAALDELRGYVDRLVAAKTRNPGPDLIGRLVVEQLRPGRIQHRELVDLCHLLLVAGHSTTSNTLGLGAVSLLANRGWWRAIRADEALLARAVDEVLRYHTIVTDGVPRVARAELVLAGARIRPGDAVIVSISSANRDEREFAGPDALDITRDARRHVAFGHGSHRCVGQHLARMELQTAFGTLARAVPTMRLAVPVEQLRFQHDKHQYGVHELPVRW
ncbi:MAG TPA: cytochrome P450 [Rugosimonospora sp.]|nr:cytochrome P450 [Rugosimonospora sp.]